MRGLLLLLVACAAREPDVLVYRVSGRVRSDASAGPALVTLDNLLITSTDEVGDFAFDNVPSGRYTLTVQALVPTVEGVVGRGVDVHDADVTGLLFDLTPTGRVTGRVVRDDGGSVVGARIFAAGSAAVTFSASDGSFTLDGVPVGTYTVVAQADGFTPARAQNVAVEAFDSVFNEVLLILIDDRTGDNGAPNELPVVSELRVTPKDTRALNPRQIPVASLSLPFLVHAQSTVTLSVLASDPEGKALTYLWSADKGVLTGEGASVEWTATNAEAEVVVVVVDADGGSTTARQRFTLPKRSIRSAAVYAHEVFYSEARENDDRDLIGFDLDTGVERSMFAAIDEQHGPRVVGDTLLFADQVFTFVQPIVFRIHLLGLGPNSGLNLTFGQTLTPSDSFLIDYRLYTPLTDGRVTYFSQSSQLAPLGIGSFDPVAGTYASFASTGLSPTPVYPCFVTLAGVGYGVQSQRLYRYQGSATVIATLPGNTCLEMQAANGRAVFRTNDATRSLVVVDLGSGVMQTLGFDVRSFVLHGDSLAYTDRRGGVTGVYLRNLATSVDRSVSASGFFDRRVLEMNDELLLFGESAESGAVSNYASDSLLVFRLQPQP